MRHYIGHHEQSIGSCVLYWIRRPEYTDIFTQGYVGITSQSVKERWADHLRDSNQHNGILKSAIKGSKDVIYQVMLVAKNREYCERIEYLLRPKERIGWNLAVGGGKLNSKLGGESNRLRHIKLKLKDANKSSQQWWDAEIRLLKKQRASLRKKEKEAFVPYTNERNVDKRNKLGLTGVSWYKPYNKWRAQIKLDNGVKFLGYFDDPYKAHQVYIEQKKLRVEDLVARARNKVKYCG